MLLLPALVVAVLMLALAPTGAGADGQTVTFSSTSTFPVPPPSSFTGSGGGDGWAVVLTPTSVFNVFHHSSTLNLACHYQIDIKDSNGKVTHPAASPCWGADHESIRVYQQVGEQSVDFSVSGQPGLYLDQATGRIYIYAVRTSDNTAGVVCADTKAVDPATNPQFDPSNANGFNPDGKVAFCGFTALSAVREATDFSYSDLGAPAQIGSRLFAFNYFSGSSSTGTKNMLLCFDLKTIAPCAGQPYSVFDTGASTVSVGTPGPSVAAVGSKVIVPLSYDQQDRLGCFDTETMTPCGGSWPVGINDSAAGFSRGEAGAPFPLLSASGAPIGVCLPTGVDPCWDLSGNKVATPPNMSKVIALSQVWNGPAVVIGPRVYLANRSQNGIECYDYSTQDTCVAKDTQGNVTFRFPKLLSGTTDWYTVNADPQRPTCLWANSDHREIANFDAFTGGACGQGPIRVVTQSIVGSSPQCFPSQFTSLQIVSPARTAYTDGTVVFADASGNPEPGATPIALDANGTADLSGLQLSTNQALPQFLITLKQGGDDLRPQAITVTVTWQGTFDTSCASGTTTIVNPPSTTPNTPPPAGPPPTPNIGVKVSGPAIIRVGDTATFTATITNSSPNYASTGTELNALVPAGSTLVSVTPSQGFCPEGTTIHCYLQTIPPGGSATVTVVVRATQPGAVSFNPTVTGDYDANGSDNSSSASAPSLPPGAAPPAPPAPTTPGTLNAISVGTVLVNGVPVTPDTYFLLKTGDSVQLDGILVFTTINGSTGIFSNLPFTSPAGTRGTPVTISVTAPNGPSDIADLTLTAPDFSACNAPRRLSAAPSSKVVRQLWGNAHGSFRTTAKYSSATIRGTIWGVVDRCDGTLTSDLVDPVTVVDLVLNKTIQLSPGQTYLAKAPQSSFTPPAQGTNTVASVKKNGLIWQGQRFPTKKTFSTWLSQHKSSWAAWSKTHKALADALASRRG